jgi:hypothetical protein
MDKKFIRHVTRTLASRFGVNAIERASGDGKVYSAEVPQAGVHLSFAPLSGRDELVLSLAWPPAESTRGYADLRRFSPAGRRELGFWIDVRWLQSVDRSFPSDVRLDTHAFLPRPVDFAAMRSALTAVELPLNQLAKRFDYSLEKTQRLVEGYYLEHPDEITLALRRSLPDWSTLGRAGPLPVAHVAQACAHWDALLDCVMSEGVAEFCGLLRELPCECLPFGPPQSP